MKIDYQNIIIQIGNENFPKCMHDRIVEIIDSNKADSNTSISLPTKDEAVCKGWGIANEGKINLRHGLHDEANDLYYSGWMDCFDWIKNKVNSV